ncbi:hypothetical protein [Marinospirillum minutulum]|uniref:hypothetical protein n=1 Tax=Marinospirillum minutulum TaxID=64974 RepID=UPI0004256A32|nr:hypothetical protein [Marinospirillum minutulum]
MQNLKSWLLNGRILLVLVLLALFAGCSDDDKGSTGSSCGTCHSPYGEAGGIDLTNGYYTTNPPKIPWNIIQTTDCLDKHPFIQPGEPDKSAILMAVSQEYGNKSTLGCSSAIGVHENGKATLSKSDVTKLVEWIENGAR